MPLVKGGGNERARFFEAMKGLQGAELQVGFFPQDKYPVEAKNPGSRGGSGEPVPVALVAATHELGSPQKGIPPRPFFRPAIVQNRATWSAFLAKSARDILAGDTTATAALERLGLAVAGDVKKAISQVTTPELADKTVEAKRRKLANGSGTTNVDKPLIDTGLMINSVTHEVTTK